MPVVADKPSKIGRVNYKDGLPMAAPFENELIDQTLAGEALCYPTMSASASVAVSTSVPTRRESSSSAFSESGCWGGGGLRGVICVVGRRDEEQRREYAARSEESPIGETAARGASLRAVVVNLGRWGTKEDASDDITPSCVPVSGHEGWRVSDRFGDHSRSRRENGHCKWANRGLGNAE